LKANVTYTPSREPELSGGNPGALSMSESLEELVRCKFWDLMSIMLSHNFYDEFSFSIRAHPSEVIVMTLKDNILEKRLQNITQCQMYRWEHRFCEIIQHYLSQAAKKLWSHMFCAQMILSGCFNL
jgi:hypothetical protein